MKVLIAHASKHGSTASIAREIGTVLTVAGCEVTVLPVDQVTELEKFDAIVLGSAIYYGHWLENASRFAKRHRDILRARPIWLFSSGPLGDEPQPKNDPRAFRSLLEMTSARSHAIFNGKLQREGLSRTERLVLHVVHAPEGDFRNWSNVREWANGIADELSTVKLEEDGVASVN